MKNRVLTTHIANIPWKKSKGVEYATAGSKRDKREADTLFSILYIYPLYVYIALPSPYPILPLPTRASKSDGKRHTRTHDKVQQRNEATS
jgi:hypothetical protein